MHITRHLDEALRHLRDDRKALVRQSLPSRSKEKPLYLWIDAICIHQSDIDEKSCQVSRMADIYRRACKAIVWLGPADDSSDSIMDYMNSLGTRAEEIGMDMGSDLYLPIWQEIMSAPQAIQDSSSSHIYIERPEGQRITVSIKVVRDLFYSISGWSTATEVLPIAGLKSLFTRPWWGRIWVLQEVTISDSTEILCGTKRIIRRRCSAAINAYAALWRTFISTPIMSTRLMHYKSKLILSSFQHRPIIMLSSWQIYRFERFPLAALLRATCVGSNNTDRHGPHHLEASDPRDKIFALLGLAADCKELEKRSVRPDYNMSKAKTYTTVMAALLE